MSQIDIFDEIAVDGFCGGGLKNRKDDKPMTFKEKVLAALAEFRRDSQGLVAATIEDCEEIVREIPEGVEMATDKRLIDANALIVPKPEATGDPFMDGFRQGKIDSIIEVRALAPTVDAVEVVRCKDCLYYTEEKKRCDHQCLDYDVECYDHWLEMEPTDFCSYGERRTDEPA